MNLFPSRPCHDCIQKDATIAALLSNISRLEKRADEERKAQQATIEQLIARVPSGQPYIAPVNFATEQIEEGFQRIFDEEGFESIVLPAGQ